MKNMSYNIERRTMETCEQREERVKVMLILTSNHPEHEGQQQQVWKEYRLKIH